MFYKYRRFFLFWGIIGLVILACGSQKTLVQNGYSMYPAIDNGEKLSAKQVNFSELKRGDIIYYTRLRNGKENGYVHRLIGLPLDTVEIENGKIYINGEILIESYKTKPPTYTLNAIKLKENEYYVLGDDRDHSSDSHLLGPITGDQIKGLILK